MSIDNTTLAFPNEWNCITGMSLRDWFAGQALAGMSAYAMGRLDYTEALESVVAMSYRLADAMLAERAKAK